MIACICRARVCCLLNFAHDRGSSTEGWILIVHIVHRYIQQSIFCAVYNKFITLVQS